MNFASNQNIAVRNMLIQLKKGIPYDINVSGLVKKLRKKVKKIEKLGPAEEGVEKKSNFIAAVEKLVWLTEDKVKEGSLCPVKTLAMPMKCFLNYPHCS